MRTHSTLDYAFSSDYHGNSEELKNQFAKLGFAFMEWHEIHGANSQFGQDLDNLWNSYEITMDMVDKEIEERCICVLKDFLIEFCYVPKSER